MNTEFLQKVNVEYSQDLWNYCSKNQIPFIYASSAATYGAGEQGYSDNEALIQDLRPLNPYGESKRLFDAWALQQDSAGNHPPIWSGHKFFNVYGFGERHKGNQASVVIHAYDQICKTGSVKLFKSHKDGIRDGEQRRDFIWVNDVIDVLFFAAQSPIKRGIYNLGTGQARTFIDLVRAVFRAMSLPEKIEFVPTPEAIRERYQYFTQAEMGKLATAGYTQPFTSLEEGVQRTVDGLIAFDRRRTHQTTPAT
jgi:ADP-L-glycero-D-manno-heptose 6-epimerase